MIFISENQHATFLKYLDESIQKIKGENGESLNSVIELTADITELAAIYFEYHHSIDQLRSLVTQYKQTQKKARVKLRGIQLAYLRQLKANHTNTSFTKTHNPIL